MQKITRENYREFNAVNFSKLSTLSFNPALVNKEKKESEALDFGSLFDCLITDADRFNDEYIVSDVEKPTAQLGEFLDLFLSCQLETIEEKYDYAYDEMKLRNPKLRDKKEKFVERLEKEAKPYLTFLVSSKDKKVVSKADYNLAVLMRDSLYSNQFTSPYFNMSFDWETQFQIPLLGEMEGIEYKGLLDMILINHARKKIIPIDIKTTGEYPNAFQKSVKKWNYLLQASLYWDLVQLNYPDYEIDDFLFFVSSKVLPEKPYIWKADWSARNLGKNGGILGDGTKMMGYRELAENLQWHERSGLWEYPRATYENRGINLIDIHL